MSAAIVLAAGRSERMGRAKAGLALPDGRSFLEAILATLARLRIDPIRVVVAPDDKGPYARADFAVVNPDPARGMLSSVQCGLRSLPPETVAALVWPVDHPRVNAGTVATLLAAHRAHRADIVVPVHEGKRGHPVHFAGRALRELAEASATATAREIVHARADRIEIEVADPGVLDDIDRPEDYERIFGRPIP